MTHVKTILLLVLIFTGGCNSYSRLATEAEDPVLSRLAAAGNDRPVTTLRYPTGGGKAVVSIALHETGDLSSPDLVVLLHGCFADHRTWRFVVGDLGRDHRLLLVDLPGSGASDRPIAQVDLSPAALADRCAEALTAYLDQAKGIERVSLVGHSLGSTTILRLTSLPELRARHAALVSRIHCMVLISPVDAAVINAPAAFVAITELNDLTVALAGATGLLRQKLAEGARLSAMDPAHALREDVEIQLEILCDPATLRACQAQLLQAVPLTDGRPDWPRVDAIERAHRNVTTPCLILWGARDETLPSAMGYKLAAQIPTANLVTIAGAKHSPHRDRPGVCADLIRECISQDQSQSVGASEWDKQGRSFIRH